MITEIKRAEAINMWYKDYFIYYHQDIWGGVYAVYRKDNANAPFHLAVNHFFNKENAIKFVDRLCA